MRFIGNLIKFVFKTILWLVILAIILGVILYLCAGKIIQYVGPTLISQVTQTEASLGEVDISLLSGRVVINNLEIGNPIGYKNKNAFELGKFALQFDPKSVLTDKIMINDVQISGLNVSSEAKANGTTNISQLKDNIAKSLGQKEPTNPKPTAQGTQAPATSSTSKQPAVVIKDLRVDDSSVNVALSGIPGIPKDALAVTVPLPNIHLQNIGENKKQTLGETALQVVNAIDVEVVKASATAAKEATQKAIQGGKDTITNI